MNISDHEDRLLDILLEEELGGESPPDLTDRILARADRRQRTMRLSAAGVAVAATVLVAATVWLLGVARYPAPMASGNYQVLSGKAVDRGATLRTTDGAATVRLGGYCDVQVAPKSTLRVEGSADAEAVYLEQGQIACEVKPSHGAFVVRTAVGTVEVTGTRFEVQVLDNSGAGELPERLRVRVAQGTVLVRGAWGEVTLRAGEERIVPGPPAAPDAQGKAEAGPGPVQLEPEKFVARPEQTPAEWLKAQPKPSFRAGHTLPPLTRYGWALDFDTRVELAENWGYCVQWGDYADAKSVERALSNQDDVDAKCIALAAKDPTKYKLAVICARDLPQGDAVPPQTWTRNARGELLSDQGKSLGSTKWAPGMKAMYSLAAPDSVWEEAGRLRAEPLRRIREKCPIAIVLNSGQCGIEVPGFVQKAWEQDPAIVKAKGDKPWADYYSARKAHAELIIANGVRQAVPDALLHLYYSASGCVHRQRWPGWKDWGPCYEDMKPVSDLASTECLYRYFNCGWTWTHDQGDALTQILNARGREIACGQPLSYNWVCGGWPRDKAGKDTSTLSRLGLYAGFLKCFYTAGMVGGNAGYYAYPPGGFEATFPPDKPPHWLRQIVALAQVHALFSHLEHYLRQGDLLPGTAKHRWSKDQPAYEFPTGDANARVVARKLKDKPQWLVTAWAADGRDREVKLTIPALGEVSLEARACGNIYEATLAGAKPDLKQVDAGQ
jgi:hypothetical protein